jgi:ribosomal-protein-alanine N-acetyltransferase
VIIASSMTASGTWEGEAPEAFCFRLMSQADAEAIARWHYPDPYSFYDWSSDPDDLAELLDPAARGDDYVAVEDEGGALIGFFQYKQPHGANLEIGLGLHPRYVGQGLGKSFLEAGLDYGRRHFTPENFTLSVARFNRRAIAVTNAPGSLPSASSSTGRTVPIGSSSKCCARRKSSPGARSNAQGSRLPSGE